MTPKYAKRKDKNHWKLFKAAEEFIKEKSYSAVVIDTSSMGFGFSDFIVVFNGIHPMTIYFEVKDPTKFWVLTEFEMKFLRQAYDSYAIVEYPEDVKQCIQDVAIHHRLFSPCGGITFKELSPSEIASYIHLKEARRLLK